MATASISDPQRLSYNQVTFLKQRKGTPPKELKRLFRSVFGVGITHETLVGFYASQDGVKTPVNDGDLSAKRKKFKSTASMRRSRALCVG
jgi:hypothetical protein